MQNGMSQICEVGHYRIAILRGERRTYAFEHRVPAANAAQICATARPALYAILRPWRMALNCVNRYLLA